MGRTAVAAIAAVFACCACGAAAGATQLRITVYPHGRDAAPARHYRLSCAPARGSVPHPVAACRTLARLKHPFAPVPRGTICAQIALGPQEALVTGTLRGRRVYARLSVRNSCEIARWHRVRSVVPGFGG